MQRIIVTAGIIRHEQLVLITQRKPEAQHGSKWEFPGGKLEPGESPMACLAREIQEELAIQIQVDDIFEVVAHQYDNFEVILLCYLCTYLGGKIKPFACADFRWVTIPELLDYDFSAADLPIVAKLLRQQAAVTS